MRDISLSSATNQLGHLGSTAYLLKNCFLICKMRQVFSLALFLPGWGGPPSTTNMGVPWELLEMQNLGPPKPTESEPAGYQGAQVFLINFKVLEARL